MIQAGILRHVVSIQKPVEIQDSLGQMDTAYETLYGSIRAAIYPLSGREFVVAQEVADGISARITIRRMPNIDATCRIVHTVSVEGVSMTEVYDIEAVLPDPVSGLRYLNLMCTQRIADGWRRGKEPLGPPVVDNPNLRVDDPNWGVDST